MPYTKKLTRLAAAVAIGMLAAVVGAFCALLPWFIPLAAFLFVGYLGILWFLPWAGLVVCTVLIMCAPDFKIADALLVSSLPVFYFRFKGGVVLPLHYVRLMKLLFVFVFIGFVAGVFYFKNSAPFVYRDGRIFLYWLWVPVLWRMVSSDENNFEKLGKVILSVGVIVACLAVLQATTKMQIVAIGRVGALETTGAAQEEFTRVQLPGFLYVMWSLCWVIVSIQLRRIKRFVGGCALLLLVSALYVNFGRGLWIWSFVAVLILMFLLGRRHAVQIMLAGLVSISLLLPALYVAKPAMLDAALVRILSVKDEGGANTSYGWRQWENQDAIAALKKSPVLGVGVGGAYRKWFAVLREFDDHPRYIHNSYLFLALKIGVPGAVVLVLSLFAALRFGFVTAVANRGRAPVEMLATLSSLTAVLGLCATQPELMSNHSVFYFCAAVVLIFSSARIFLVKGVGSDFVANK